METEFKEQCPKCGLQPSHGLPTGMGLKPPPVNVYSSYVWEISYKPPREMFFVNGKCVTGDRDHGSLLLSCVRCGYQYLTMTADDHRPSVPGGQA